MKAMVRYKYGSPEALQLEEIQQPIAGDDELLIRVRAVSLNLGDWELLTGDPPFITVLATIFGPKPRVEPVSLTDASDAASNRGGLFEPKYKILGTDLAGTVESVSET